MDLERVTFTSKRLEVLLDDKLHDIALVDVAISKERFVGARAIWEIGTVHEVFLTRAEPASIGLSPIGARLHPLSVSQEGGLYLRLGGGGVSVVAPVAPGLVQAVDIAEWRRLPEGEKVSVELRPCTVALDGEREFSVVAGQRLEVSVNRSGPRVVQVEEVLRQSAAEGLFQLPADRA